MKYCIWEIVDLWTSVTFFLGTPCISLKQNIYCISDIVTFNPNQTKGGGGGWNPPPPLDVSRDNFADFFSRAPRFRYFFLLSLAQLLMLFSKNLGIPFRSYATLCNRASAQNMGIFWICVQNIWKMAFCAKNRFWALKVCYLHWFS